MYLITGDVLISVYHIIYSGSAYVRILWSLETYRIVSSNDPALTTPLQKIQKK